MGRKLSYCKDDALAKAAHLFSSRGYEKTCMREIAREIDVPVASLYHTFGDKNALLTATLEAYFEHTMKPQMDLIAASHTPFQAIESSFLNMIEGCSKAADAARQGCMMLHTATELGDEVPAAAQAAKRMLGYARDQYAVAIKRGQETGEITRAHSHEFLSSHLVANMIAIKTWLRMGASTEQLRTYAGQALGILKA
jgi:TetR/AcrR family transcriptional repressor of nem operon